jgi:hypothetical protein
VANTSGDLHPVSRIRRHSRGNKRMEYILTMYRAEHPNQPIEPHIVSPWAIRRGFFKKPPIQPEEILRKELSRHLKNAYFIDPQGREVRSNHAVFIDVMTPQGTKRRSRWLPLFEAPPEHMSVSAQLRRRQALSDVIQLTLDLESYNENNIHGAKLPLPDCDFNKDVEESRQPATYPTEPPDSDDDDEI